MALKNKSGALSAKLLFVLIAGIGVMILIFSLARSDKFETVQVNLSESASLQQEQLRDLGQLEEDVRYQGKIVLTQANLAKYIKDKNCSYELDSSSPKTTEVYSGDDKGIEFNLPYSDLWGSDEFMIMPYDELEDEIYFGPLLHMPDCSMQRAYLVKLHETAPTAEILADLSMRNIKGEWEFSKIKDRDVIKFVEYNTLYSNCESVRVYLLGKDYDYEFIVNCSEDTEMDFAFLEQVLTTVKFD